MLRKAVTLLLSGMLIMLFISVASAESPTYIGVKNCKACHFKEFKSWEQTPMAKSFEDLKAGAKAEEKKKAGIDPNKDYTADKNCLKCHTTGYGKPGGFKTIADTPDLAGAQCESCHGPGSEYRKVMMKNPKYKLDEVKAAGLVIPSENEKNCTECHGADSPFNEKVDAKYKFNFKERLKKTHEHFPPKYQH